MDGIADSMDMSFEQTLGGSEEQGSLACYSSWSHKESDMTYQLNNNNFGGRTEITIDILIKGI